MKEKALLVTILFTAFACLSAHAVDSMTATDLGGSYTSMTWDWTSDGSGNATARCTTSVPGIIFSVYTEPSADPLYVPTDNYDLTVQQAMVTLDGTYNTFATDLAGSGCLNRDNAAPEHVYVAFSSVSKISGYPYLSISNAGSGKKGRVTLYIMRNYTSSVGVVEDFTVADDLWINGGDIYTDETAITINADLIVTGTSTLPGLVIGTDVQAWDADLDTLAGLAKTDSNFIVGNGTAWVAESGATARASMGVTIGTNVQAWDNDLDDIAALTHAARNIMVSDGTDWTSRAMQVADVPTLNQNTTGSAATLTTARAINGVDFNGSAAITVPVNNANDTTTNATMYPLWTATAGGNYAAKVTTDDLTFNPSTGLLTATGFSGPLTGNVTGNVSGSSGSCTGNAATATNASQLLSKTWAAPDAIGTGTPAAITGTALAGTSLAITDYVVFDDTGYNTKIGYQAGKNLVAGAIWNTYVGYQAGASSAVGSTNAADANTATGTFALVFNKTGLGNLANGYSALFYNETGSYNTSVGTNSLVWNVGGSNNVAFGACAGGYETGSNSFYVNNVDQVNTAGDKAYSLLYGTFAGAAGSLVGQQLTVNGTLNAATVNIDGGAIDGTPIGSGTPSTIKATTGTFTDSVLLSANGYPSLNYNAYYSGGWKFINAGYAWLLQNTISTGAFALSISTTSGSANGTITWASALSFDAAKTGTFAGDVAINGGDLDLGVTGTTRGTIDVFRGASGNTPGYAMFESANGTDIYVSSAADGTIHSGTSVPAADSTNTFRTVNPIAPNPVLTVITADDTTPTVTAGNDFYVPNTWTAGHNITDFDDGIMGQTLRILGGDSDCVVVDGGDLVLAGNWTATTNATLVLHMFVTGTWTELSRSAN